MIIFSIALVKEVVHSSSDNVIISPYSVANALVLLSQATGGNSFEQIKNVLNLNYEKAEIADQFFNFYNALVESAGNATFTVANEVFVQEGSKLNANFQDVATQKLFSGVESVDFLKSVEATATINQFVEKKTNDKIKNLFTPDVLDGANAVLVNAIYLKAYWQHLFKPYDTYKQNFFLSDNDDFVSVDFMHATTSFNYVDLPDLDATVLELKYYESDFAFVIVLPKSKVGLSELEVKLKDYDLSNIYSQFKEQLVKVAIPKFKVEYSIPLNDILIKVMKISQVLI